MFWSGRGENAVKERRDELRKVAKAEIARIEANARTTIQTEHLTARVKLTELGLHSIAAKQFLKALPSVESLMPPLRAESVERIMLQQVRGQREYLRPRIGADAFNDEASEDLP